MDVLNKSSHLTRSYVDINVPTKKARVATTANSTFSTAFANGQAVDGVTLATGDRILLKNQTDQTTNGIYIVQASGAPLRASDANTAEKLLGCAVYVREGNTNADTQWLCTNDTITLGATNIAFDTQGNLTAAPINATYVTLTPDSHLTNERSLAVTTDFTLTDGGAGSNVVIGENAVFARKANNLSDLANASTARTNLGLGTLATQSGTFSGTSSGTNTGDQTLSDATISLTDITTNNVSTTKHGFAPKAPNDATKYLDGTGAYSVPAGGGSSINYGKTYAFASGNLPF